MLVFTSVCEACGELMYIDPPLWGLWWTNVYSYSLGKAVCHLANGETSTEVSSPLGCGLVCTSIDKIKRDITSSKALESVQKIACKICLKQWDMDYESMLQQLELTSLL